MLKTAAVSPSNRLLKALSANEYEQITPHLKPVELTAGKIIYQVDEPIEYIYFPEDSILSTMTCFEDGTCIETGITGREGMTGFSVVLANTDMPRETVVQSPGSGWQIPTTKFLSVFESGEAMQRIVLSYIYAFFEQVAQSGACINHHPANRRLARWLLMCHDRTDGDNLFITHDFIAQMLGVYRPTVTQAAITLKDKGLIKYSRGTVTILDRRGLEKVSCECYQSIKKIYDHYLSVLEMRHLSERIERTTGKISVEIERHKTIQLETSEQLQNLKRAVADIKNLPVRIRVCEKCQRFCDSRNNRRFMSDYIGKRINAEFMSVVCTTCAKSY